jgi:putative MATE family efflux protein
MHISFAGVVWGFTFMMYQALMRAVGDTKRPLYLVAASVAINITLDPLLIFGIGPFPTLGVAGAAWATLVAQAFAALAGLRMLFSPRFGLHLNRGHLVPDRALIGRVARLGLPASLEQATQALGLTTITLLAAHFGTESVAAYGIGMRVLTFVIIPAFGISMAASTLVGQSFGAGDPARAERVTRVSATLGFCVLGTAGALIALGAESVVHAFVPGDPALVSTGASVLHWMAPAFALMGLQLSFAGTYRGAGDTLATMALSAIGTWVVQLPLAWSLSSLAGFGATGIWMAYPFAAAINTAISFAYLRHGRWRKLRITAERKLESQVTAEVLIEEGSA